MTFFQHIVFDLDDTILDTSGTLIPAAARRAVEAMRAANSKFETADTQTLLERRKEILRLNARADVWLELADGDEIVADIARRSFFTHPIDTLPDDVLRFTSGAKEILQWARMHATLHLVTAGDPATQTKKIDRLGIRDFFNSVQIVETHTTSASSKGLKHLAFQKIHERFRETSPIRFLSIGNRVDTDLGEAKLLAWKTAWIRYGEHANLTPQKSEEIPDFEVASLGDLLSIWRQQFDFSKRGET